MRQTKMRTAILGAAALCWGIMFPEYTFTADSYTAFVQEADDAGDTAAAEYAGSAADTEYTGSAGNAAAAEYAENAADAEDLRRAVRDGKVRYRFWIFEYLKRHLFGAAEFERGIIHLWDIRNKTGMRRSECLIPASAG